MPDRRAAPDGDANPPIRRLIVYCRAGYEAECAEELLELASAAGYRAEKRFQLGSGFAVVELPDAPRWRHANRSIRYDRLIFARQLLFSPLELGSLPAGDRVSALVDAIERVGVRPDAPLLETADTNEAKTLSRFLRGFGPKLTAALEGRRPAGARTRSPMRLHLFFLDSSDVHIALSDPTNSSPHPMGIPRLRMPAAAPSRSALKLVEALSELLSAEELSASLRPGMRAVDLGAAPGGWSLHLASRGLRVTAVDNGSLAGQVLRQGLVEHVRADGFSYRPSRPVAWMTCDIIDRPARVAGLVAEWFANGWCAHCVFNLKLPMKRRLEEVRRCAELITRRLDSAGVGHSIRLKHLFHDRDEVTAYVRAAAPVRPARRTRRP